MKKETIIAVVLGLMMGAVVAFFLIFKTQEKKIENTKTISSGLKVTPTVQSKNNLNFQPLEIKEPEDKTIVNKNTVMLKGKAVKSSLIIIQSQTREVTFENDKENFEVNFPLLLGENIINITAYNNKAQLPPQTKELKIYYFEE